MRQRVREKDARVEGAAVRRGEAGEQRGVAAGDDEVGGVGETDQAVEGEDQSEGAAGDGSAPGRGWPAAGRSVLNTPRVLDQIEQGSVDVRVIPTEREQDGFAGAGASIGEARLCAGGRGGIRPARSPDQP
ncbi:hypothetical protein [Streptomyces sp. NEAU-NA10]|uniref:hypothetical protein n=1 Tax=Streptomyces sp. NEAU-NA10 TaxID=3416050 RepID=UPI003CC6AA59